MPFFEITYTDGTVEEFEADEVVGLTWGHYLTLVRHRVLFVTTIYTEVVRRLDRRAVARVDEAHTYTPRPW